MKTLKRYFTQAEIDFLLDEILLMSKAGIGPVESGVPIEGYHSPDRIEFYTARKILDELKVGDSRTVENKVRLRPIVKAASSAGIQLVIKRIDKGEYRIWKISEANKVTKKKKPRKPYAPRKKVAEKTQKELP
jgi:hypothetical protein